MQISIRSYLTVGTATVVGAGAIAMTPVLPSVAAQTAYLPVPAVAEVTLTGLSFSLTDVVGLLGNADLGGLLGNPDLGGLLGNLDLGGLLGNLDLGGLLGNLDLGGLLGNIDLGGLSPDLVKAVVAEFIKEAAPVVKGAAGDVFQYVSSSVTGLVIGPDSIPVRFGAAIGDIPTVVKTAFGELLDGSIGAALLTLNLGLIAPITSVGKAVLEVVDGIKTFVSTQISTLVAAAPGLLMSAIAAVIGNGSQGILDAITNAVNGLVGGLLPAAATPGVSRMNVPASGAVTVSDTPAISDTVSVVDLDTAPAAAAVSPKGTTPRAASSVSEVAAAAKAEVAVESESPALQVVPDDAVAPVTRPRAALRSAIADEIANGPAVTTRPKQTLRTGRQHAERPNAAAASRSE